MNYKIVKLKNLINTDIKSSIDTTSLGLLLNEDKSRSLVMIFNNLNQGDYAIQVISNSNIEKTDFVLSEDINNQLEQFIKANASKILNKTTFNICPFNECDHVELVVEKDKYAKRGLHKGDKGIIATNKAIKNTILVDFGINSIDFDGLISVDIFDLAKVY